MIPAALSLYEGCLEAAGEVVISAANNRVRAVGVEVYERSAAALDSTGVVGSSASFSTSRKVDTMVIFESSNLAARERRALDGVPEPDMAESRRIEFVGDAREGVLRAV